MVLDLGAVAESEFDVVRMDVAEVRAAVPSTVLKVIVESALWSPPTLREVCEAVVDRGGAFVKTYTGFHPAGPAPPDPLAVQTANGGPRVSPWR